MNSRAERSRAEATDELLVGPIRGELLGADHLAARARAVARGQRLVAERLPLRPARLLARLAETRRILTDAHARLVEATSAGVDTGPAAEWLLDNFHVVQEQLQEVRASLPGGYYRELPELSSGPLTGYPRVYEMAISIISHTEARIHPDNLDVYVEAFQTVSPLTVGELWAMPAMLRLGLIESVRRMTLRTVQRLDEIELARVWAERILSASERGGSELRAALRAFADAEHALTPNFVSRFLQSLRQAEGASPPLQWIEHWMRDAGVIPEQAVAQSTQRLALTQIMMANSIMSLRDIGQRDWRLFVEQQSAMDAVLRNDPSGHYRLMTFSTRDSYRHAVERVAKQSRHKETIVAQWAIDLARHHADTVDGRVDTAVDVRLGHVGYYLIDDGVLELEAIAGYSPTVAERVERYVRAKPNLLFIGGVALTTLLATMAVTYLVDAVPRQSMLLVLLFTFLPALDIAVTVLNQLVTALLPPKVLPRLDLHEHGVSAEYRTAVVVPTLFGDLTDVREALENLEVQFLANREEHLHFAVLSDFTDACRETQDDDQAIVDTALEGIRALNERYSAGLSDVFHLLHRPRRWNPTEGVWMGWERKRGKLSDFNQLLRSEDHSAFSVISGPLDALRAVQFVITLDADTVLPPDAAPSLVGAMAHPLNRAVYDPVRGRIVRGYGILQPRVGIALPSANRSRFASIASGHPGVDPYSTAVSDVYQDLYGEGSFTGKGIYDVDAFQLATHGRFPENTLLSHDLIEGNYARAGLATDVVVYDDYPSTYRAYTLRKHRWIRGDWQLLPWLRRYVPGPDGRERNRLSLLSQWKIVDNLRRSTVELSQLLLLVGGWTLLPGSPALWTLIGLGAIVAPWATSLLLALVRPPRDRSWGAYYSAVRQDAAISLQQAITTLVFLPHQAYISLDAIVRTLYRMAISRRHLLEWRSASIVERGQVRGRTMGFRAIHMIALASGVGAVAVSIAEGLAQTSQGLTLFPLVLPGIALWSVVVLWMDAPGLARRLSAPAKPERRQLSDHGRQTVRRYARLHWTFFERFVTQETHWLAPDNFQAAPRAVVAMRTSPTNIGLQLLATVSAHDLGFIAADDMTLRLERTITTLEGMRRYRGHFYNWYDLADLHVLEPAYVSTVDSGNLAGHLLALRQACMQIAATQHSSLCTRLESLADRAYSLFSEMEFGFLYDTERKLFTIGYHPDSFTADASFYDLLASEARLASFVAIARNDVPVEHWFRLSRMLNRSAGATSMVSWSGSMFEFLMPLLVMRSWPATLLEQTYTGVVERQRTYAQRRNVPWGVSESAYNLRDREQTYQYRAFGVPDLALKRGLGRDLVVAPYATALALQVAPALALENLEVLESLGALGDYGFCDALDYTRPAVGERFAFVATYMAHHVGMSLVAFTNVLNKEIWQQRFHADPLVKSAELLLHERVPRRLILQDAQQVRPDEARPDTERNQPVVREIDPAVSDAPRIALLGSMPYTVMLNHTGSGFSRYEQLAVTRWNADGTSDDSGQFCYVNDLTAGRVWSAARRPLATEPDWSRTWLASDRATLRRIDGDIETRMEITVVPADAAEVRRVTLTNTGAEEHIIELTSYGEIVMNAADADRAHPAFANLFVETEWHGWSTAITATRRPRSAHEPQLWCVHVLDEGRDRVGDVSCETDRSRFLGRGRTVRDPQALHAVGALSMTTGAVLDPVFALRTQVRVAPGQSVSVAFTTLVATSRESAFELAGRYHDAHAAQRALDLAWTSTQIELAELGTTPANAAAYQDLASQLLFRDGSLAPPIDERERNRGSQPRLWPYGISGDLPIVLATIDSVEGLPTLRDVFAAHRYWRRRGVRADLVVINAHPYDYLQELRDSITESMVSANDAESVEQAGGVHVRRRDVFQRDDYLMLSATARVHIPCDGRPLARLVAAADDRARAPAERESALESIVSALRPLVTPRSSRSARPRPSETEGASSRGTLLFDNGIGGMDAQGDYCMTVDAGRLPPAPWANVIANAQGGFVVSERGSSCTWAENAHFFRLTPWHNDPVSDVSSDAIYLQDAESDAIWSPTPAPIAGDGAYTVHHGAGSSMFSHQHEGIHTELLLGVPAEDAVKLSVLRMENRGDRTRRLTVTAYVEWTLGARRELAQTQVRTRHVPEYRAIMAHNAFDESFANWAAFLSCSEPVTSFSGDRLTFLGRGGSTTNPAALQREALDGRTGVDLDPCGALQMQLSLAPGEVREIAIVLGACPSEPEAKRTIDRFRSPRAARAAITESVERWRSRLSVVTVKTPDPAFDAMINKWTLYQALGCRIWARAGLYQSSGAFGFRDQLQDVMALLLAEPALARAHILRAAARQFREGDVQHWWHAHTGRGVRTRFSDDLVWLPFVVEQYVTVTGDASVLDEYLPFLDMRTLEPHEHELYDLPTVTDEHGSVYEHCRRALRRACTTGAHGLPLIGTGDWNDGMSRVGADGKGESVWLAWFLVSTLRTFAVRARSRGDDAEAAWMEGTATAYVSAIETHGWDGQWYRRAFYDDGTPMGSAASDECRIDSIAQSWSVISRAGSDSRQQLAMRALDSQLVREDARLIMLLTPPFDRGSHDPGYIKGYLPGVRENGAQYTHAALWAVMATAMRGDGDRAFDLYQMLNPIRHADTAANMLRYKVEPYVVAADIYTAPNQLGRGGWTWYTGSASWMYRVGLEQLLGFTKVGDTLRISPRVPRSWSEFSIQYRFGETMYEITVRDAIGQQARGARVIVDGVRSDDGVIHLRDDGVTHIVTIEAAAGQPLSRSTTPVAQPSVR